MKRPVDHNQARIDVASRAVALAKRIDKLTAAAIKLQADAMKGETAEIRATDGRGFSGGWSMLASDTSVVNLDRAASELRRAARNAGLFSNVVRAIDAIRGEK